MSESIPTCPEKEPTRKEKIIALAMELSEREEAFSFPGIATEVYEKLKADIAEDADRSEYDIMSPTLDELIARFNHEGMKVTLGKNPKAGNVLVMPMGSSDIQNESLLPKHLLLSEGIDERLKELILLVRG